MGIYTKNFSLISAIKNDEVDLIFGESNELLEEIAHIKGSNRMQIIIRNFIEDVTDSHWFSMKFIPARNIKSDSHAGRKGIPIVFEKLTRQSGKETIEYLSDWKVYLGSNPSHVAKANAIMNELNKKERAFISTVIEQLGFVILEYWSLDPNIPSEYNRLREIQEEVESRYIR